MDDIYSKHGAICPHCGYTNDPSDDNYRLYSEDTYEWECGRCDATFNVSVYVSHSWTTSTRDAEDD